MKIRLIIPLILLICIGALWQSSSQDSFQKMQFEGFISESIEKNKAFFLQDIESGQTIELKFIDEDVEFLSFNDFGYVAVKGHYNQKDKYLIVDAIQSLHYKKPKVNVLATLN